MVPSESLYSELEILKISKRSEVVQYDFLAVFLFFKYILRNMTTQMLKTGISVNAT